MLCFLFHPLLLPIDSSVIPFIPSLQGWLSYRCYGHCELSCSRNFLIVTSLFGDCLVLWFDNVFVSIIFPATHAVLRCYLIELQLRYNHIWWEFSIFLSPVMRFNFIKISESFLFTNFGLLAWVQWRVWTESVICLRELFCLFPYFSLFLTLFLTGFFWPWFFFSHQPLSSSTSAMLAVLESRRNHILFFILLPTDLLVL